MDAVTDNGSGPMLTEEYAFIGWLIESTGARSVLEIGTGRGEGVIRYSALDLDLLVTVDINMRTIAHFQGSEVFGATPAVSYIEGSSHDAEVIRRVGIHAPYDLIILDGDHTFAAIKQDFAVYFPMLRDRGACFIHDVDWGEVSVYWQKARDLTESAPGMNGAPIRYRVMPNLGLVIKTVL